MRICAQIYINLPIKIRLVFIPRKDDYSFLAAARGKKDTTGLACCTIPSWSFLLSLRPIPLFLFLPWNRVRPLSAFYGYIAVGQLVYKAARRLSFSLARASL
jgi:hypothetical protein